MDGGPDSPSLACAGPAVCHPWASAAVLCCAVLSHAVPLLICPYSLLASRCGSYGMFSWLCGARRVMSLAGSRAQHPCRPGVAVLLCR